MINETKAKRYDELSKIVSAKGMSKLENLYISLCPDKELDDFVLRRAEKFAMREPSKSGFVLQASKQNDNWVDYIKSKELNRLKSEENR